MADKLCAFNAGSHKFLVAAWGRSCRFCHRTWEWRGDQLVPTWKDPPHDH